MSKVAIVLLTFNRLEYAEKTLSSVLRYIHLSEHHELGVHIADDGSSQEYRDRLVSLAATYPRVVRVTVSNSQRRGYGGNYNESTMYSHSWADMVLPLEDDWELQHQFSLDPMIDALNSGEFGCIRMGYVGWTQQLRCEFRFVANHRWLLFDPFCPEPHVFSGHPRLETVEFQRRLGLWPEHLTAGATEFTVAHRPEARHGIAWPVDFIHPRGDVFCHIGSVKAEDPVDAVAGRVRE